MANTYVNIASQTLGSNSATVTFSSIPATYTDLLFKASVRSSGSAFDDFRLAVNGNTTNGSFTYLQGNGSAATSGTGGPQYIRANNVVPSSTQTANTFANIELYFPNYAGSTNKPVSIFAAGETNSATAYISSVAGLWSQTTAISSLVFNLASGNFVTGSTFYLYGIKNS
jgi:hypothetical protein